LGVAVGRILRAHIVAFWGKVSAINTASRASNGGVGGLFFMHLSVMTDDMRMDSIKTSQESPLKSAR
jgi:hypothetical protein